MTIKPLDPQPEPLKINVWTLILASFLFALMFGIVGVIFRYYIYISGAI